MIAYYFRRYQPFFTHHQSVNLVAALLRTNERSFTCNILFLQDMEKHHVTQNTDFAIFKLGLACPTTLATPPSQSVVQIKTETPLETKPRPPPQRLVPS